MTLPDFPYAFYAAAVVAILLTGIVKGGFGGAAGGLAVPIMSIWVSPAVAAGADAVLAASVLHFGELGIADIKRSLTEAGCVVR